MNFGSKPLSQLFHLTADGFLICSGNSLKSLFKVPNQSALVFSNIVNTFGISSAKSQALKQVITTMLKFSGTDQRIYFKVNKDEDKVLGFLRSGQKNLFYRDYLGNIKQLRPTCVLDIYVHQSCQRSGIGKQQIFQKFLQCEKMTPEKLAYDRPSEKLISFLKKHYNLVDFIQQNNNFVIFDRYFGGEVMENRKPSRYRNPHDTIGYRTTDKSTSVFGNHLRDKKTHSEQVTDSLHILEKEVESRKNIKTYMEPFEDKINKLTYRTPWAVKNEQLNFYTTSKQYGNYFGQ